MLLLLRPRPSLCLAGLLALAACNGGNGTTAALGPGSLRVLAAAPAEGATVPLNETLRITFDRPIDLDSLDAASFELTAVDALQNPVAAGGEGTFSLANGGTELRFAPRLPRQPTFDDGGLRPGLAYRLRLAGSTAATTGTVRGAAGETLSAPFELRFTTVASSDPEVLFRDPRAGGPLRAGFEVASAADLDAVPLGLFGAPPLEVRLHFDQPLDPAPDNVPVLFDSDPRVRDIATRGRIYLEYEDPDDAPGTYRWLPTDVELERNENEGATVLLRPVGVLPNHATVRVIAEAALRDLVGQTAGSVPGHDRVFGTFRTEAAWRQQWNGIVEAFDARSQLDPAAPFAEPAAVVGDGFLRAAFAIAPTASEFDWAPMATETVLDTHATTLQPVVGPARAFANGVFDFRNLTIPAQCTVLGRGRNPLVLRCSGKVEIDGKLSVRGGNGQRGRGINLYRGPGDVGSAASASASGAGGGIGAAGGGDGGTVPFLSSTRTLRGGNGTSRGQTTEVGGRGGRLACEIGCYTGSGYNSSGGGSGGGGGTLATQGDPHYRGTTPATIVPNTAPTANTAFQQVCGFGGAGCSGNSGARTLPNSVLGGGEPGDAVFTDTRTDNDFWGSGFDANRRLRIAGELPTWRGGTGGGAGGNTSPNEDCTLTGSGPNFDHHGGGGGGGGGVVVIQALGEIWIRSTGSICADGGHGGGGEQVGACGESGGGGGGAGGMVILMSATAIRIEAHGNPAANRFVYGAAAGAALLGNDYDFAISADGGVCATGGFGAVNVTTKYPAAGQMPLAGASYDTDPLGGFGGLGIVQLMVPPGSNGDGTNTVLDDNVFFYWPGQLDQVPLPAALDAPRKRQLLAWRGFADASGTLVDDFGQPTAIGNDEGDIRPAPVLLPAPYGPHSRARSRWIDTGASVRRPLGAPDAFARGIVLTGGAEPGPVFEAPGRDPDGYLRWDAIGTANVRVEAPVAVTPTTIVAATAATWLGAAAYRVQLAMPALGDEDRYAAYDAELLDEQQHVLGTQRIFAHSADTVFVTAGAALPANATRLRVVARIADVTTGGVARLPSWLPPGATHAVPSANVRIGFAFHVDPAAANPLAGRYPPSSENAFVHDLDDPQLRAWLVANRPRFVMWDVLFDLAHDAGFGARPLPTAPELPQLEMLRLPFRF